MMHLRAFYVVASLVWMGVIFLLSAQTGMQIPQAVTGQDKIAHLAVYGVLGALLSLALHPQDGRTLSWRRVVLAAILATAYGMSDEFHQSFVPGRESSVWDLCADAAGGLLGALLVRHRTRPTAPAGAFPRP